MFSSRGCNHVRQYIPKDSLGARQAAGYVSRRVRSRWFNLAILLFEAFFLNVVVPGHQRGVVQLPGSDAKLGQTCPFCCCDGPTAPNHSQNSKSDTPEKPTGTCAICAFAAQLSLPPVFDCTLTRLMLLCPVADQIPSPPVARIILLPFDERGPPISA